MTTFGAGAQICPIRYYRPREERIDRFMKAISKYDDFVMSGSMGSIRKAFDPCFALAVFMTAPAEIRAERLRIRAVERRCGRALPSGWNLYERSLPG